MSSSYFQNIIDYCLQVESKSGKQERCALKGILQSTVYLVNMITLGAVSCLFMVARC